ncbi:cdc24p [Saccharomyces arboricola H-6]|uniref:Cdc24p n=1 Tax=Saccharomyces arboricola (strain H-6 / AS 2.3317 / CBS 10644) TaxID=1160507 RepID=J8Q576_SACAR|nr:cdc24p [Saccharomyces arboricola H-6]
MAIQTRFASGSSLSDLKPKSSTTSISIPIQNVMNKPVTEQDSLYHICANIRRRLERLPQLKPFLQLAYQSSEVLSERQSLLLSQKQHQEQLKSNGANRDSNDIAPTLRSSSISTSTSLMSMEGISYTSSNPSTNPNMDDTLLTFSMGILPITMDCDPVTQLSQLFQQGAPLCILFNSVKPQFNLPVIASDDLKVCKKSIYDFILGCKKHFAFNDEELFTISDVFANSTSQLLKVLDVVETLMNSSPSIFPTKDKIQQIMSTENQQQYQQQQASKKHNDYVKIIKEFVATERKYVHDLEILDKYRQQLLNSNIITSEELYMLFPNLSDAIDFQRRFLISLEMNALVEPSKQRIGALFMHSKHFFKLYEPWSIGQNAAIEFLTSTLHKMRVDESQKFIINNKLELQSFLYKPVQRLCRYPLLIKELLADSSDDNNTKELEAALDISKNIARSINENQRRTENHQVVKKLYGRVVNWKGYRISKFGELLYFDKVFISTTNNSTEPEREFEVYLFEKIIILFSEVITKKSASSLILKKKSSASASMSTTNITDNNTSPHHNYHKRNSNSSSSNNIHLSSSSAAAIIHSNTNSGDANSNSSSSSSLFKISANEPKLDLRGRIMIMNLNQIIPQNNRSLNITWESIKEQGNFLLKFKNEETRDNWSSCLQQLIHDLKNEQFKARHHSATSTTSSTAKSSSMMSPMSAMNTPNHQNHRQTHDSMASYSSSHMKRVSDVLPKRRTTSSSFESEIKSISENFKNSIPESSILLRISYNNNTTSTSISEIFTLLVEKTWNFDDLIMAINSKIANTHNNTVLPISKIKYQDEDGDFIILGSDEDWNVAKDMLAENNEKLLNIRLY